MMSYDSYIIQNMKSNKNEPNYIKYSRLMSRLSVNLEARKICESDEDWENKN